MSFLDSLSGFFGGGSSSNQMSPSQGPNNTWSPGYQTPDQLSSFSMPTLSSGISNPTALVPGWNANQLATAYGGPGGIGGIGAGAASGSSGFGLNLGTGQLAMSGLSALGNLWSAYNANSLGKKQLDASMGFANANLANQIKSYNTTLADREQARGVTEGLTPEQVSAYVKANSLSR